MQLKIKRLTDTAKLPAKAHKTDAGFDIFADETVKFRREGDKITLIDGHGAIINDKLIAKSEDAFDHKFDTYIPLKKQLNDNQQIVLDWLKEAYKRTKWSSPFGTVYSTINIHELFVRTRLTKAQQFQVLAVFAEWGCKSNE